MRHGRVLAAAPARLTVDRVAMLMRHGIRPPTKDPALPPAIAPDRWPRWPVPAGWLTPHGARAIGLLATADRRRLAADGVLPAGTCPAAGAVTMVSDSDQRTIATGDAYLAALAPGCPLTNRHRAQDDPDPLFDGYTQSGLAPRRADRAVADALGVGGIAAAERRGRIALAAVDRILCGARTAGCGVASEPSGVIPARDGGRPRLTGALDRGSTAAQVLLLEYAEGKPLTEVGWGRATADDIALTSALHATEFAILARPPAIAAANLGRIADRIADALTRSDARLSVIVGHDTNVANLAGLLDLHWQVPGFAADDPAPGGALILERLHDAAGHAFVRTFYRSQTLEAMRTLDPAPPVRTALAIGACGGRILCPLADFTALIGSHTR